MSVVSKMHKLSRRIYGPIDYYRKRESRGHGMRKILASKLRLHRKGVRVI